MNTEKFHDKYVYNGRMRRLSELILPMLKDSKQILDVGCGDGKIDALLMEKGEFKISGVDVLVREKTFIPVQEYDGINLPKKKDVDTVMAIDVLHHTDCPMQLFKEMVESSAKYIIIKDHYRHGLVSYIKLRAMDYVGNAHYKVRLPYNYLRKEQWLDMFRENQLVIVEQIEMLNLYKGLFHIFFDRNLHFIVKLKKNNIE